MMAIKNIDTGIQCSQLGSNNQWGYALAPFIQADYEDARKPVESLGPKVREDEDGFDDLEDYFGQEFDENKTEMNANLAARLNGLKIGTIAEDVPGYVFSQPIPQEYTVPVKGTDEEEEVGGSVDEPMINNDYEAPLMDDDYGYSNDNGNDGRGLSDEEEIHFSPNITLHRPSPMTPSPKAPSKQQKKPPKSTRRKQPRSLYTEQQLKQVFSASSADDDDGGIRHSRRNRIRPLEFWRGETVKYRLDSKLNIPVVAEVIRRDRTPMKRRARSAVQKKRSASSPKKRSIQDDLKQAGYGPKVNLTATIIDYDTHKQTQRLIAVSRDEHDPAPVPGEQFSISTVFEEGAFMSAGILCFPPGVEKPSRNSAKYALVFYVIEGIFDVTINQASFTIGTGGQFMVPRGNHYSIKSKFSGQGKLHFCHCMDSGAM